MMTRYLPIVIGLLAVISITSSTMLLYRLIGFSRSDALYLACLTVTIMAHIFTRWALRKSRSK